MASPAPADTDDLRSAQHCDRVAGWPIVIGRETWSESHACPSPSAARCVLRDGSGFVVVSYGRRSEERKVESRSRT